jgi:hypothetical protein
MLPQTLPYGLFWKKRWYRPSWKTRPLGSFSQVSLAVKWMAGRNLGVPAWAVSGRAASRLLDLSGVPLGTWKGLVA